MVANFVRALGAESGIQLNPLVDGSEFPSQGKTDQAFCMPMRATRGRIDRAFAVNSDNFFQKLGRGQSLRSSVLNEAWIQCYEALNAGAYTAVVSRLINLEESKLGFINIGINKTAPNNIEAKVTFDENAAIEDMNVFLVLQHLECFNDGIIIEVHAEENQVSGGLLDDNNVINLVFKDVQGIKLYSFVGSLDPEARDDYGNSLFIEDVIEAQTDNFKIKPIVNNGDLTISPSSNCYGYDQNGREKWYISKVLDYFQEGEIGSYTTQDYIRCRQHLQKTQLGFKYIGSGGSLSIDLLSQLMQLSYAMNIQFRFDIHGSYAPYLVIQFMQDINATAANTPHLLQAYWTPFKSNDPTGINGKIYIGTSGLNIGLACARNAIKNDQGFAAKQYPIAGDLFPVNRTGIVQTYTPENSELSQLAIAKVNPVIYESNDLGGQYLFSDSLTCAPVTNSLLKLISVAEMSTSVDSAIVSAGKRCLQKPMDEAIKAMDNWIESYLSDAQAAKWLVKSNDTSMDGMSYRYEIKANPQKPYDEMIVNYWCRYNGTVRQIFQTQTLSR